MTPEEASETIIGAACSMLADRFRSLEPAERIEVAVASQGIRDVLLSAFALALNERRPIDIQDLVLAALEEDKVSAVLAGCEVPKERLIKALGLLSQRRASSGLLRIIPAVLRTYFFQSDWCPQVVNLFALGAINAAGQNRPQYLAIDLLEGVYLIDHEVAAVLNEHTLTLLRLRRFLSHGYPDRIEVGRERPPGSGKYGLLILNDSFTTMDFVQSVFAEFLGLPDAEAQMLAVHEAGSATVGVYSFEEAESLSHRICSLAEQSSFPLDVTPVQLELTE